MTVSSGVDRTTRALCCAQVMGSFGGGGAQRLAYNLALGMASQGAKSLAIALREEGDYAAAASDGVEVVALGANARKPFSLFRAFFALRNLIRREGIELLHVHGAPSLPFVVLATRGLSADLKLGFTWHDSESVLEQKGWRTRVMVWALRRCDAVSGSSQLVAQKLQQRAGLQGVGVFYGGVPVAPEPLTRRAAAPLIVWLGRIVPPKDPQLLIRAAARLREAGAEFSVCILGKPSTNTAWYMAETRALIANLGLESVVRTPGFARDDELKEIMHQAEISVQTSHTEGLSLALLECMMSGQAVVATDVGDTAAAVEDGVSGLLIPPKDEPRLTEALHRILTDPELRTRLAAGARRKAVKHFSVSAMSARALEQYSNLVGRKR